MTLEHYAALAAFVLVAVAFALIVGYRQMLNILARFDAKTLAEPAPAPVVFSAIEMPEAEGWSSQVGWNPRAEWARCLDVAAHPDRYRAWMDAADKAWAVRVFRDTDSAPILAALLPTALAIEPAPTRELVAS